MEAGRSRDAVVAAVASLTPESVKISARGDNGWAIVFRPARFERASMSDSGHRFGPGENAPAQLASRLVRDVNRLLGHSNICWPGLTTTSARAEVQVSEDGVRVSVCDDTGHCASSSSIPLWTAEERQLRGRARADLDQLALPEAPASARYLSLQLTRLLLTGDGRLRHDAMAEAALRLAAFCDLTFLEQLGQDDKVWEFDPAPTGQAHLDRLMEALITGPDQDFEQWIDKGPNLLALASQHLVAAGTWREHLRRLPGFVSTFERLGDPTSAGADAVKLVLSSVWNGAAETSPAVVSLATCASIARAIDADKPLTRDLLDQAGAAVDVVSAGLDWADRQQLYAPTGTTRALGDPGPMPGYWG